jgi:hypothetical protein
MMCVVSIIFAVQNEIRRKHEFKCIDRVAFVENDIIIIYCMMYDRMLPGRKTTILLAGTDS